MWKVFIQMKTCILQIMLDVGGFIGDPYSVKFLGLIDHCGACT